ncbi:hypothetical protein DZE41_000009 [Clostridium beijerinckii]|uniref:hypothetical protein n=1 Tax=Clostridium beijerinckii TaxID=1520 RepID=UPI001A9AEC4B|nr:hypothetical protein [Clostridium beijerinckii]NRZ29581.1 hypothetical protein [Clostridium beijerinckii]
MYKNNGIVFDEHFSNALIKSAAKMDYVEFNTGSDLDRQLVKSLMTNREYGLLRQKCFELALLL